MCSARSATSHRPESSMSGSRWAAALETSRDRVHRRVSWTSTRPATAVDGGRRMAGRCGSNRPPPTSPATAVLAQEERHPHLGDATPKPTTRTRRPPSTGTGLDVLQADAAAAVAGDDRLVVVVGPAGAGKTTMLACAVDDLDASAVRCSGSPRRPKRPGSSKRRPGWRPTRWPSCSTNGPAPTGHPTPRYRLPAGATVIVDEAGMIGTRVAASTRSGSPSDHDWRLVLVGDPHQLQAVGRGGMFAELCATGRSHRAGPHPPVPPTVGSRRVPATATRRPRSARRLRSPRPDHRRTVRRSPRPASPSSGCSTPRPARRSPSPPPPTTTSTPSTTPSNTPASTPDSSTQPISGHRSRRARPRRRRGRHPPQRPHHPHHHRRTGPQPRPVDRHRHPPRRRPHRRPQRWTRHRPAARRLRRRARAARLRRHRARQPSRHRRHRHRPRLPRHHPPRACTSA